MSNVAGPVRRYRCARLAGLASPGAGRKIPLVLVLVVLLSGVVAGPARAESGGFSEEGVRFGSGDVTLRGTILVPDGGSGRKPAIALVHGAGPHTREDQRDEAEAFARRGIVTLIYDKRTEGYSQFERSYELLADDALAATRALREHPEVDSAAVGLWGLSEGGWVVPLAANRSRDVAFVVLVAASGVPPSQQHSWNLENELRHQGVAGSMVRAVSRTGTRLIVDAGLFAEANHDPIEPLERLRQPVLALWGAKDRIQPPAESARILREALLRGGNERYTVRFFPDAEHGLRASPDGYVVRERLAPGYAETVASWTKEVARGRPPGPSIAGPTPEQARLSHPLAPLAWWESVWVQLGTVAFLGLAFASYPAVAFASLLARPFRGRARPPVPARPTRRGAGWLTAAGLATLLGFVGYFGFLMFTAAGNVGPVLAGRAVPWLALQALAVMTVALAWWPPRPGGRCAAMPRWGIGLG